MHNSQTQIKNYIGTLLTYWKFWFLSFTSFFHKINLVYTLSRNLWMFSNFFVLCQISKDFGKCFGPCTPKFSTQMLYLFIIKICFTVKVIQSVVRVGILEICVTSSTLRVLLSRFCLCLCRIFVIYFSFSAWFLLPLII